jgi:NADH:ubiquinone oxidoreductase subunit 4 (subunit M)
MPILDHLWIILALPLAGAAINGLLGKNWPKVAINSVGIGSVSLSFLSVLEAIREFSLLPADQLAFFKNYFNWIVAGSFKVDFALQMDHLTIVMLLVVTFVSLLVHIYSDGLHGARGRLLPLLCLHEFVRFLHAHAGAGRKHRSDVRRVGRRGPLQLLTHRILVPETVGD